MRILMLSSSYPLHATDSASIFLRHLALCLSRAGAEIQVLAPDHVLADESIQDPAIQLSHFRYLPRRWQTLAYGSGILPNLRRHPWRWFQVPFFMLSMSLALARLCRRTRPDVIHAHWILPQGLVAVFVGRLLHIPVVTTAHGGDAFSLRGGLLGSLKRYTLHHSQAWTANTRTTAAAVGVINNVTAPHIIPMGVDVGHFARHEANPAMPPIDKRGRYVILFVGRLVEKKGVFDLIEAFKQLPAEQLENTALWIIGDGTDRERLERLAGTLNINSRVCFFGRITNDELPAYYAAADIFVAPSIVDSSGDTEGQGVVIIEAMASGVPVVACKVGGIPDVITHEQTGLLVEPQNSPALSAAISRLLHDSDLRHQLSYVAQQRACQHYAWESIAKQFLSLFASIANKQQ